MLVVSFDSSVDVAFGAGKLAIGTPLMLGRLTPLGADFKPRDPTRPPATDLEKRFYALTDGKDRRAHHRARLAGGGRDARRLRQQGRCGAEQPFLYEPAVPDRHQVHVRQPRHREVGAPRFRSSGRLRCALVRSGPRGVPALAGAPRTEDAGANNECTAGPNGPVAAGPDSMLYVCPQSSSRELLLPSSHLNGNRPRPRDGEARS